LNVLFGSVFINLLAAAEP